MRHGGQLCLIHESMFKSLGPRGPLPGLLSSGDQPLPGWLSGRCPRGLSFFWAPLGLKVRKLPFSKELGASGELKQEKEINVPCLASRGPGPCPRVSDSL